jgi:CspA family cold shock protein
MTKAKESTSLINTGVVKFFNVSKGFGFITDHATGKDVFFHFSNTLDRVVDAEEVTFEIETGDRGPKAIKVARIKKVL